MKNLKNNSIPTQGIAILRDIYDVIGQLRHLESDCTNQSGLLQKCEKQLFAVTVDVAFVCCDEEEEIPKFIEEAGIHLPKDLNDCIQEMASDDGCLK